MNKKHIITIAGRLGSGKSSTAKMLAQALGYEHYSTGDFMRSIAEKRGLSLMELSKIAEGDPSIDKELDDKNVEIGKMENIIIDTRLGFHFIPNSFKVFLELDPSVAAERILEDKKVNPNRHKEDTNGFDTKELILKSIEERSKSERLRYKTLYGIEDFTDPKHFDLIINTGENHLEEVSAKIAEEYEKWLNEK